MDLHDRVRDFFAYTPVHACTTWLGMFGAASPKCVKLWSSDGFIYNLQRTVLGNSTHSSLLDRPGHPAPLFPWFRSAADRRLDRRRFGVSTTTIKYKDKKGVLRFKGGPGLKMTQTYPSAFGRNVSCLHAFCFLGRGFSQDGRKGCAHV